MAIIFQCPNCGANISDQEDQSILSCPQCGTTVTKYIKQTSQIDVNIQSNNVIRNVAEEEKQKANKIEAIGELVLLIAFIVFCIFLFTGRL